MNISRTNQRVTMLIERLDDSMHTLHGEANGSTGEITLVAWDDGHETYEMWLDLRPEPLKVGDRVIAKGTGRYERIGVITHSSHAVEFGVRWAGGGSSVVRAASLKRADEPAETQP